MSIHRVCGARKESAEWRESVPTVCVYLTRIRWRIDDRERLEERPHDLESRVGYRVAHGEAARLAKPATFDHGWGQDFAAGVGGEADAIDKEVLRRLGPGVSRERIKPAVQDAMERRKPRW